MKIKGPLSTSSSEPPAADCVQPRRLARALAFAVGPFLLASAAEIFILPPTFVTWRGWEGIVQKQFNYDKPEEFTESVFRLPGPFYPNMRFSVEEEGDLGHGTPQAVKKSAEWRTDNYGYRTDNYAGRPPEIVIVGDSLVAGSTLTQSDTLSEVLAKIIGKPVYPMAPCPMEVFLRDRRFIRYPPRTVIFCLTEWRCEEVLASKGEMAEVPSADSITGKLYSLAAAVRENPAYSRFLTVLDRSIHSNIVYFLRTRIIDWARSAPKRTTGAFFWMGARRNDEIHDHTVGKVAETVARYNKILASRGITLVFAPVPNKETIYYQLITPGRQPTFLPRLLRILRGRGVRVVDIQAPYNRVTGKLVATNDLLYQQDDTHWNSRGVRIAAEAISRAIPK